MDGYVSLPAEDKKTCTSDTNCVPLPRYPYQQPYSKLPAVLPSLPFTRIPEVLLLLFRIPYPFLTQPSLDTRVRGTTNTLRTHGVLRTWIHMS